MVTGSGAIMSGANEALIQAFAARKITAVQKAIDDGADVNARTGAFVSHPIWFDQMLCCDWDAYRAPVYNAMWEIVVPHAQVMAVDMKVQQPYFTRAFFLTNPEAVSLVMLGAIRETKGKAKLDLKSIFSSIGDGCDPHNAFRVTARDTILASHRRTRARLAEPKTPFERAAATALVTDEAKAYWLKPITVPPLEKLPMPVAISQKSGSGRHHRAQACTVSGLS